MAPAGGWDARRGAAPALSPVASVSKRDAVINEIRRAIVLGNLTPGEKITESRLSLLLRVSRPTIREAINQLAQEGLLVQAPYSGMRVADLEPQAILDIARTRVALDMLAVTDILADPSGRRLELVQEAWLEFDRLADDADPLEAHEAHIGFHRRIWQASENRLLVRLWPVTEAHLTIALASDQATRADPRRAHTVHERLVEAILSGDLDAVHAALLRHTMDSAEELIAMLIGSGSGVDLPYS